MLSATAIVWLLAVAGISQAATTVSYPPAATLDEVRAMVDGIPVDHPRLMTSRKELAGLQTAAASDPFKRLVADEVIRKANLTLDQPPLERVMVGVRLLSTSRLCLERVLTLSLAFHLTGDARYAKRAEQEMIAASRFENWNPAHFLDVAEMTLAIACGYDWLFDQLDPAGRAEIRSAILDKGVRLQFNPRYRGWIKKANNWGQVCHAGMTAGAIAVLEEDRDLAARTIHSAIHNVVPAMNQYAPRGGYPEGPHYWSYGTSFNIVLIDALEHALGTDFGLCQAPGFRETGAFVSLACGPTGDYYNYSDGGADREPQASLPWLAARFDRPEWMAGELDRWRQATGPEGVARFESLRHFALALLWAEGRSVDPDGHEVRRSREMQLPLHWSSGGLTPIAVHRSAWTDRASFLAVKGGSPATSHSHMDGGSFVLESDGVRWAVDLGREDYHAIESQGLDASKFDQRSDRWKILRYNNHGHNTLAIDGRLQRAAGAATIAEFSAEGARPHSVVDVTALYEGQASSVRRGVAMLADGQMVIRDELTSLKPGSKVRWQMITRAEAAGLKSSTAKLAQAGESLALVIREPAGAAWEQVDMARPPQPWDSPNPGCRLLAFTAVAPANGKLAIDVLAVPGSCRATSNDASVAQPLGEWSEPVRSADVPDLASRRWPLFVQDNGVGRDQGWTPAEQAKLLGSLGYAGIGYSGLNDLDRRQGTFRERGLKIYAYYIPCETDVERPFGADVDKRLVKLHGADAILWTHIRGTAPTDKVADALRKLGDAAAPHGVRIAIYPHFDSRIETAEEALEVIRLVDRPNVGLSLTLSHELRIGNGDRLDEIVDKVKDRLMIVSINGADKLPGRSATWPEVIKPLGEGTFDVGRFLTKLAAVGYQGPIALQCFSINQPPPRMLATSMTAWTRLALPMN